MRLIHVTDAANLDSIKAIGLDHTRATGKRAAVWAVTPSNEPWAILHTLEKPRARRAGRTAADHVVLEIEVPRSWLVRYQTGVWYCYRNIPFSRVRKIRNAAETAINYPTK